LAADTLTRIRFVPSANFSGDVPGGITFRAWDQTSGTNGGTADTSTNGGATAFSSAVLSADIRVAPASSDPWQNPANSLDVNNDGVISPLDVLTIINEINSVGSHTLPNPVTPGDQPPPYYDVNGDGSVTPLDALAVINYINSNLTAAVAGPTVANPVVANPAIDTPRATIPSADTAPVAFAVSAAATSPAASGGAAQNQSASAAATDRVFASYAVQSAAESAWLTSSSGDAMSAFARAHRVARGTPLQPTEDL
jgi:hypothetical protein